MTPEQIEAGKSPKGGFTRKQLAEWGVPWPPPKGWRKRLTGKRAQTMPSDVAARFARGATAAEIERAVSPAGGWNAATLAFWGVAWPPRAGWKAQLINNAKRNGRQ